MIRAHRLVNGGYESIASLTSSYYKRKHSNPGLPPTVRRGKTLLNRSGKRKDHKMALEEGLLEELVDLQDQTPYTAPEQSGIQPEAIRGMASLLLRS